MLDAFALSDQGCIRTNNEDYCAVRPDLGLYVVADGMGGAKAGEEASRLAVDTMVEWIEASPRRDSQVLLQAVEEAHRRVMAASRSDASLQGMGTTLLAALEIGEELSIVSVGDSRAYLFDGAVLQAITQDQTWINEVGRSLGLDEESLRNHPMRHVLTMAIGATSPLTINYYAIRLAAQGMLLMCTDGLHGVVPENAVEQILQEGTLETQCRRLIEAARAAGGPDNITAILLRAPLNGA